MLSKVRAFLEKKSVLVTVRKSNVLEVSGVWLRVVLVCIFAGVGRAEARAEGVSEVSALLGVDINVVMVALIGVMFVGLVFAVAFLYAEREALRKKNKKFVDAHYSMKARVSDFEALLGYDLMQYVILCPGRPASIFGGLPSAFGVPQDGEVFLSGGWLPERDKLQFERSIIALKSESQAFSMRIRMAERPELVVEGSASGLNSVLRVHVAHSEHEAASVVGENIHWAQAVRDAEYPAWIISGEGDVLWNNLCYDDLEGDVSRVLSDQLRGDVMQALLKQKAFSKFIKIDGYKDIEFMISGTPYRESVAISALRLSGADKNKVFLSKDISRFEAVVPILDQAPVAIVNFSKGLQLQYANTQFVSMWNLEPEDMLAKPSLNEVLEKLRVSEQVPAHSNWSEFKDKLIKMMSQGAVQKFDWHLLDGRIIHIVTTGHKTSGAITMMFEDITDRVGLQARLNGMSSVYKDTLESIKDGLIVFGSDGKVRYVNKAMKDMWHLPKEAELGWHASQIFTYCQQWTRQNILWQKTLEHIVGIDDGRSSYSGRHQLSDGRVVDFTTVPLEDGATMVSFADVTDSINVQKALEEKNEALEDANKLKNDFVQHVSYELRSPLTTVIGFTQLLADKSLGHLNDKQSEYLDYISKSSTSLLAIINDILDLATIDAGAMELNMQKINLRTVIEDAVSGIKGRILDDNVKISIHSDTSAYYCEGDEQRIKQILYNLISNAINFSGDKPEIGIELTQSTNDVIVSVNDNGIGMPEELIKTVFERFVSYKQSSRYKGVGLGLSIVKSFVELHHGNVQISSTPNHGTTVTCTLPKRQGQHSPLEKAA